MKINVDVTFNGTVAVEVPDSIPLSQQLALAQHITLSRVVATTDNPDAPDEDACDDLARMLKLTDDAAGELWDKVQFAGTSGSWLAEAYIEELGDRIDAQEMERREAFRKTPEYRQYIKDMFGEDYLDTDK